MVIFIVKLDPCRAIARKYRLSGSMLILQDRMNASLKEEAMTIRESKTYSKNNLHYYGKLQEYIT